MEAKLAIKYERIFPLLDEKQRRAVAASDAEFIGWGGIAAVSKASGMSRSTISIGMKELRSGSVAGRERARREGGGRKTLVETDPCLGKDLELLVCPVTRGDPESPLAWCSKSLRHLAAALQSKGHRISHSAVGMILKQQGFSLQANRTTHEGGSHPDRDAQFEFINHQAKACLGEGQPVISVDCKKKELIGNFKNGGREWELQKRPTEVNVYDFMDKGLGKAVPYGVYDIHQNQGWVNVGVSGDTAQFAVSGIRTWWEHMGRRGYPNAKELLITADGGGSNSSRSRLWKREIQAFSNQTGMQVRVCHFPPGTSKWNKIEHKMFSFISMNWRGKPLTSLQVIVNLIGATTSKSGLHIKASIDENRYERGIKVRDDEFEKINIEKDGFHGEWNYVIRPVNE
ncbi:ISAzo13 family transposase [soil metagenome]